MSYITIEAAAERLSVTPRTIRRLIAGGSLPGYRIGKKVIRIDADDVEALLRPIPTAGDAA